MADELQKKMRVLLILQKDGREMERNGGFSGSSSWRRGCCRDVILELANVGRADVV